MNLYGELWFLKPLLKGSYSVLSKSRHLAMMSSLKVVVFTQNRKKKANVVQVHKNGDDCNLQKNCLIYPSRQLHVQS